MSVTETQPVETLHLKLSQQLPTSPGMHSRRQKIKLDPLRALEPARKKLSTIEAQRIMCVLEETHKRCELISALPFILINLDKYVQTLGPELTLMLTEHKKIATNFSALESKHAELTLKASEAETSQEKEGEELKEPTPPASRPVSRSTSRPSSRPISNRGTRYRPSSVAKDSAEAENLEDLITQIRMVELQIALSLKGLIRAFSLNPGTVATLIHEVGKDRAREGIHFGNQLTEMRDILMEKLLMTPSEENEKMQYLSQVSAQERHNSAVIEKLEGEVAEANAQKDHEIRLKNDIIRKLQNDLHMLEKSTEEEIKRTKTEAEKQEAADNKNSEGKRQKLLDELNELNAKKSNLTTEHREEEQSLRRHKWKVETEVENWIQKYDGDMGEKQDEFEEIDEIYTEEKRQLNELEERFKTLETEYKTITEAKNKAKEEREAAERQLTLMIRAATTIQAVWRSYKVRKALKLKNKKGKKGKKK